MKMLKNVRFIALVLALVLPMSLLLGCELEEGLLSSSDAPLEPLVLTQTDAASVTQSYMKAFAAQRLAEAEAIFDDSVSHTDLSFDNLSGTDAAIVRAYYENITWTVGDVAIDDNDMAAVVVDINIPGDIEQLNSDAMAAVLTAMLENEDVAAMSASDLVLLQRQLLVETFALAEPVPNTVEVYCSYNGDKWYIYDASQVTALTESLSEQVPALSSLS